jgi:superfamily I DNA/RNA helicase
MNGEQFFSLANLVLGENKRAPLAWTHRDDDPVTVDGHHRVLQIVAGPGSGKTEMIVWRVLYELFVNKTPGAAILMTTFTRKAAGELMLRVVDRSDRLIHYARKRGIPCHDPGVHNLRIGTIHAMCDALLSEFDPDYRAQGTLLIDDIEAKVRMAKDGRFALPRSRQLRPGGLLYEQLCQVEDLVALFRPPWDAHGRWPSRDSERANYLLGLMAQQAETWWPRCSAVATPNGAETVHRIHGLTAELELARNGWRNYLRNASLLDFASVQQVFRERQDLFLPKLSHVFVDEFQDTNPIQFSIHTYWLRNPTLRLTVVGDDDQSIYRFRGSDIGCFTELEPFCKQHGIAYHKITLTENHRSTKTIVNFSGWFKQATVLSDPRVCLPKKILPAAGSPLGLPVRLLSGPWDALCRVVASELRALRIGEHVPAGSAMPPTAAVLMYSVSEQTGRPAQVLRAVCEAPPYSRRLYNPRSKTAGEPGSPIVDLLALLSYLIDPVRKCRLTPRSRPVEVWATNEHPTHSAAATSAPPRFRIAKGHALLQKRFLKANGGAIGNPASDRRGLCAYIDRIRADLVSASGAGLRPRLSISGLVARLLRFDYFRRSGFTINLFRQAMFTRILEANVAPTRTTTASLDNPMTGVHQNAAGKTVWPDQYWSFLGICGGLLENTDLDDEEVDSFAQHAVSVLTFHQTKGLEFDHVYVAAMGRSASPHNVLVTKLFSGQTPAYSIVNDQPVTTDANVLLLAEADREREVYVAMTRAKASLTFLHDPSHTHPLMQRHPAIMKLFDNTLARPLPGHLGVEAKEISHA